MEKILFLLKDRFYSYSKTSYGLINSASHLAKYLETLGNNCKVATVVDANFIDKEVHSFKPDIVVIEALWVQTAKLKELIELPKYKRIKWVIRVHSDMAFLSSESQGLKLLNEYVLLDKPNLVISLNNKEFVKSLSKVMCYPFTYLPNVILTHSYGNTILEEKNHIDIGCFGATRLLKNQCFQAICAMRAADRLGKKLNFHITSNLDQGNDPILSNLIELFVDSKHDLIIHDWLPNHEFQELVRRMDIGLQISFTESFNIVTTDFIDNNRLILVSEVIDWMPTSTKASTTNYTKVVSKIVNLYKHRNDIKLKIINWRHLNAYNGEAKHEWCEFLDTQHRGHHGKDKDKRGE